MSDMSDAYAYASNGPIEPFWHRDRINRLFLLPLDKTVLTRIGGLSAAFVASFALLLFGGFGVVLLVFALLAVLVSGVRYGFKIIERSSKGFLRPSDYPLTNDDLVSEYLPYKYAAMNLVFGVLATLLQVLSGGNEFVAVVTWLFFFVAIIPAATMRLVITGTPAWCAGSEGDAFADPARSANRTPRLRRSSSWPSCAAVTGWRHWRRVAGSARPV